MPVYLKVQYELILVWQELHQVMPIMGIHVLAKTPTVMPCPDPNPSPECRECSKLKIPISYVALSTAQT